MVYSLAITITLSVHPRHRVSPTFLSPPPPPPRCSSYFTLLVLVSTRRCSFSLSLPLFAFSLRFFGASSPCPLPIILSRRPQLFRNCFRPFLLLLRLPQDFACLSSPRTYTLPGFLLLSHSLSFLFFAVHPFLFRCLRLASTSRSVAPFFGLSLFSFILEKDEGIHETKLMITASEERAKSSSGYWPSHVYTSSFSPLRPFSPLLNLIRLPISFLPLSLSFTFHFFEILRERFFFFFFPPTRDTLRFHYSSDILVVVNNHDYTCAQIRSFCRGGRLSLAVAARRSRYDTRTMAAAPRRDNRLCCL